MLDWFEKAAPIKVKFTALLIVLTGLSALSLLGIILAVAGIAPGPVALVLGGASLAATFLTVLVAGRLVSNPYVAMVVRMEALAAGDTSSPILHSDHGDCVGRMARAMAVFRKNAEEVTEARSAQQTIVETLGANLKRLAANDLDCHLHQAFPPAYDELRQDFNAAVTSLATAIGSVRSSAHSVLNGASEIRAASDDLANRNEQQAATLEETAAAMGEVTSGVKTTARNAGEVQKSIASAHHEAAEGGEVVARATEAMAAIERSSQEIAQIINVIDGIAFQTNLLALNAGVEAARAGDAGRGFAVVASEVRALAQRSADAAKDIKVLITASTQQVGQGVTLVAETGSLLGRIVNRVGEINGLIADIATNADVQATSLDQVNTAVGEMDRVTQQNAAMVEQSTAAARSLADEARELNGVVARFRTGHGDAGEATPFIRPARRDVSAPVPLRRPTASAPARTPISQPARMPASSGNLALKASPAASARADDWSEF